MIEASLFQLRGVVNRPRRGRKPGRAGVSGWRHRVVLWLGFGALLGMAGCETPVDLYHRAEGGDIARLRQPIPGSDLPYPNLASVPAHPRALTAAQTRSVEAQLAQARQAPELPTSMPQPAAEGALGGLVLPGAPPPEPQIPGIDWEGLPQPVAPMRPKPAKPVVARHQEGEPLLLGFRPGSAILDREGLAALAKLAAGRGPAQVRVGGFGEQKALPDGAALTLALERARRIADALTASGVPAGAITLVGDAAGYGGFAQLVY